MFNTIEEGIADIREGKMIIVVDDEDRENEGDLVVAAEKATGGNQFYGYPCPRFDLCTYGRGAPRPVRYQTDGNQQHR